ncbi:MAG: c-type cytochrome [bacterium]
MQTRRVARLSSAHDERRPGGWGKGLACVLVPLLFFSLTNAIVAAETPEIQKTRLKNPYTGDPKAIAEGRTIFLESGCPKCHGNGATGGEGPNLTDDVWVISGKDGDLFHAIQKGRKKRKGQKEEMPSWEEALEPEDIWKVISWIRSIYKGEKSKIVWKGVAPPIQGGDQDVPHPPGVMQTLRAPSQNEDRQTPKDKDAVRKNVSADR